MLSATLSKLANLLILPRDLVKNTDFSGPTPKIIIQLVKNGACRGKDTEKGTVLMTSVLVKFSPGSRVNAEHHVLLMCPVSFTAREQRCPDLWPSGTATGVAGCGLAVASLSEWLLQA